MRMNSRTSVMICSRELGVCGGASSTTSGHATTNISIQALYTSATSVFTTSEPNDQTGHDRITRIEETLAQVPQFVEAATNSTVEKLTADVKMWAEHTEQSHNEQFRLISANQLLTDDRVTKAVAKLTQKVDNKGTADQVWKAALDDRVTKAEGNNSAMGERIQIIEKKFQSREMYFSQLSALLRLVTLNMIIGIG